VGHLVQPPCRSRVTYSRLHRNLSSSFILVHNIFIIISRNSEALLQEINTYGNFFTDSSVTKVYPQNCLDFFSFANFFLFFLQLFLSFNTFLICLYFCPLLFGVSFFPDSDSCVLQSAFLESFFRFFIWLPLSIYQCCCMKLLVERSQHSLQDCRTTEAEDANKGIGSNSIPLKLQ